MEACLSPDHMVYLCVAARWRRACLQTTWSTCVLQRDGGVPVSGPHGLPVCCSEMEACLSPDHMVYLCVVARWRRVYLRTTWSTCVLQRDGGVPVSGPHGLPVCCREMEACLSPDHVVYLCVAARWRRACLRITWSTCVLQRDGGVSVCGPHGLPVCCSEMEVCLSPDHMVYLCVAARWRRACLRTTWSTCVLQRDGGVPVSGPHGLPAGVTQHHLSLLPVGQQPAGRVSAPDASR